MRALTFTVVVYTSDERHDADDRTALTIARQLHQQFGAQHDKNLAHPRWELHAGAKSYGYDPFGDDMGNHEDHDKALIIVRQTNARGTAT